MGLSIEQKYNICLMAEKHPKWTQAELAQWAYQVYQLPSKPSQGTISRLLAKKSDFMNSKEHEKDSNRLRRPNNLLVHKILQEWVSQSIWNGIPVSLPIIQDTAQSVWHKIPPEHREGKGSFSHKWVANFLSRMNLSTYIIDHQMPKHPKVWYFDERSLLKKFISHIPQNSLYTLDETFLAYNLPLDYAQYESNSIQKRLEVITVMLCANLNGTDKMDPMIIGRYENYQSFKNYFPEEQNSNSHHELHLGEKMARKFGISYQSNRKSWLTSTIFHDWLVAFDKRLVSDGRKIWLILDDSCSHRIINLRLQNIQLIYTSANSKFLPFNWGVLEEFKTRYRIQQYKALIDLQDTLSQGSGNLQLLTYEQSCLTMSNAFKFIKISWDAIKRELIHSNWKKSGILPPNMLEPSESRLSAFKRDDSLELKLNQLCETYWCMKKWDYSLLLNLNIENKNKNFLSLEEIIESSITDQWEAETSPDIVLFDDMDMLFNSFVTSASEKASNVRMRSENSNSAQHTETGGIDDVQYEIGSNSNKDAANKPLIPSEQNQKIPTVSELIDSNSNDIFGNMLESNLITNDMLTNMFGDLTPIPDNTSHTNSPSLTSITKTSQPIYEQETSGDIPINHNLKLPSKQLSPVAMSDDLDSVAVSTYINQAISNPAASGLDNEKLVMMTTLQSNIDLAKAMGTILKHSEIREVGLSASSLNELKTGYGNCLKRIKKAKHFINSLDRRKLQQNIEQQFINSTSVTPDGSIGSVGIDNTFFTAFDDNVTVINATQQINNNSPNL